MFGKLNHGQIEVSNLKSVVVNGVFIRPVPDDWFLANGYKRIVEIDKPNDGCFYSHSYAEDAETIYDVWTKMSSEDSGSIIRKNKYENEYRISWNNSMLTVDQANAIYLAYFAEGRDIKELQDLIKSAKASIRASEV